MIGVRTSVSPAMASVSTPVAFRARRTSAVISAVVGNVVLIWIDPPHWMVRGPAGSVRRLTGWHERSLDGTRAHWMARGLTWIVRGRVPGGTARGESGRTERAAGRCADRPPVASGTVSSGISAIPLRLEGVCNAARRRCAQGDQGQREPGVGACPTASPSSSTTAMRCWSSPAPASGSRFSDDEYVAAGATLVPTADDVFAGADLIVKVKEPIAAEYHRFRAGSAAVHVPAPGRRQGVDRVPAGTQDRLDRLRDRADGRPQAPAAHPDERGRRPDVGPGRGTRPGEPGRRCRHPARWRARAHRRRR